MKSRPNARLLSLQQADEEYGIPYGTLYQLVKEGHLPQVRLPNVRRVYVERRDLEQAIERWKELAR